MTQRGWLWLMLAVTAGSVLWAADKEPGSLRTVVDYRTGQPVAEPVANGVVYQFRATVPNVAFWKVPVPLEGLWIESADRRHLTWLSSLSGLNAVGVIPCLATVAVSAGAGVGANSNCPPAGAICGSTPYDPSTEGCCNGTPYPLATEECCTNNGPYDPTLIGCCGGVMYALGTVLDCCGDVIFNTSVSCCSPNDMVVPKDPIVNLEDCPNRVARADFVSEANGCTGGLNCPGATGCTYCFKSACDAHDHCYDDCSKRKGDCDSAFGVDLAAICAALSGGCKSDCIIKAAIYLTFVQGPLANIFYETAQKAACICCP